MSLDNNTTELQNILETINDLPEAGSGSGTGDGFSQIQADYAQNDSSQPDYIKNRPFYTSEGYEYEWDGKDTDATKKVYGSKYNTYYFYKIADVIMTVSDFVGADVEMKSGSTMTITESGVKKYENGSFAYRWGNYELIFVCVEAGSFETVLGTTELTPGLWFLQGGFNVKVFAKEGEVKQLDNEYIAKATAIDDANADLPVTAGLLKTELTNKADLVEGKIPVEQLPDGIGNGSASGGTGEDGVSPTIDVKEIEGGHEIIITDIDGEKDPIYIMDGIDGKSAYQIAYDHNFAIGTEAEWIASLKGDDGKSAYEIAYELDSTIGTKEDWIESLKGSDGDDGTSVTIISTTESENDGGSNIVTFSDGSTITIKNGSTGAPFTYDQFKPEELEALKPVKGTDYFDGDDYILTDADKTEIANETKGLLDETVQEMREIASGKCKADAFDTVADMTAWLSDTNNTANLKLGDVFYIRAVDVPDYWWEPIKERVELSQYTDNDVVISGIGAARVLETTKVKLEDYALIANVPNIKVNHAVDADTIGGKQIVVSNEAPDPNGEDNQNIITIVI